MSERSTPLSPLKQAYIALEEMQRRLDAAERSRREPIAIVGLGCRFPGGASSPESFWRLLRDGVDATCEVPRERWDVDAVYDPDPDSPGKAYTRRAGFLTEPVDQFDPEFFGIAPREARGLDPQQRLLLEVAWEALEHAGQAPSALKGTRTAVFVGIASNDYAGLQLKSNDPAQLDLYYASGIAHSIAAGRLSYLLGLQGPCVSLDTACSSSLVAVHLAVQSLRSGECRMALAGGVNLILAADNTIAFSKARMLAPDGRCKTFDARADGFADGEGCGVVVLKKVSDAIADKDRILAVIRGTAINQDGASSGLTVPNGPAQEALIRDALATGGVEPREVGYVEAHGTGTPLGDPIEVQALGAVLREGRPEGQPFLLGAVKANIGHLEAAAGIAGLIKLALMMEHGAIPPHLNFETPNPFIPWDRIPAQVVTELTPWPRSGVRRVAGVSSFGFSGTNAHIVVEEPPIVPAAVNAIDRPAHILALSAQSDAALRAMAGRYADHLAAHPEIALADVAYTANVGRSHFAHRLALVARTSDDATNGLAAFARGESSAAVRAGEAPGLDKPRIAFLFTGQGSQYAGMGRGLYAAQPVFRAALDRCAAVLDAELGRPLLPLMFEDPVSLNETAFTQPALFALEYSLSEMWRSWGIEPGVVLGHSVGEYVAACVAGVFSLEDGLRLIAARGRLMQALPSGGAMLAVMSDEGTVGDAIAPYASEVSIAALNGPSSVVISGSGSAVRVIGESLAGRGIKSRPLSVSHAFHSPLMEPMLDAFERVAGQVSFKAPQVRLISNLTGKPVTGTEMAQTDYWRRHVRQPVRFAESIATAHRLGYEVFLEIGPGTTLIAMGQQCVTEGAGLWVPSLRSGRDDWATVLAALGALYVRGNSVDWAGYDRPYSRSKLSVPTYPFQRQRFWRPERTPSAPARHGARGPSHPLLGRRLRSALPSILFESQLNTAGVSLIDDHRIHGVAVLPATAYIEMALAAAASARGWNAAGIEDLTIREPLIVREDETRTCQLILDRDGAFSISSAAADTEEWRQHATGRVRPTTASEERASLGEIRARCDEAITADAHYEALRALGLDFGPSLHGVRSIRVRPSEGPEGEALGEIALPPGEAGDYLLHPALLDACVQVVAACGTKGSLYLPLNIESIEWHARPGARAWSHVRVRGIGAATLTGDVSVYDDEGRRLAALRGIHFRRTDATALKTALQSSRGRLGDALYTMEWRARPRAADTLSRTSAAWLPAPGEVAEQVRPRVASLAQRHRLNDYAVEMERLEALSLTYVRQALRSLGWEPRIGERVTPAALAARLGIVDRYHGLLNRMLGMLADGGLMVGAGGEWEVRSAPIDGSAPAPASNESAAATILARCGPQLGAVLHGDVDPLSLLFPGGSLADAEKLYRDAPFAQVYNALAADAVFAAVARLPTGRRLRVLEVGGGTGGTTAHVLERCGADVDYTFTDVSPLFTAKAQERFANQPHVRYQPLDIERDPAAQGLESGGFDLVIAANVVHATADLRQTLRHARRLLAPEGLLLLIEVTTRSGWVDLTFGLTEGWWRFTDRDLRPDYPLLTRARWLELLADEGFMQPSALPDYGDEGDPLSQNAILLARNGAQESRGRWLILADSGGVGRALRDRLEATGERCALVVPGEEFGAVPDGWRIDPARAGDFERVVAEALHGEPYRGVVHLWNLEATPGVSVMDASRVGTGSVLLLVQALANAGLAAHPRLWLLTRGAQAVMPGEPVNAGQSITWGLARTVRLEFPEFRCSCIDLGPSPATGEVDDVLRELLSPQAGEDQVALRRDARFVARMARLDPASSSSDDAAVRLRVGTSGSFDDLTLEPASRQAPGPGEVEVRVLATGLNFRDVMNVLGMRSDSEPLGSECSGRIVALGEGVDRFAVGDSVIAIAPGSFGSHVTVPVELVVRKPVALSYVQAATLSLAFLTAEYALHRVGRLRRGESVLIHAAAGGVGLAAVQIARRAGALIFATAGSAEKRAFLESLGVAHVLDSRNLDFAEEITRRTQGAGVDVVLNSLTGDFISRSLGVLRNGGRFLEIGKRELLSAEAIARLPRSIAYHAVDLTGEVARDNAWFRETWTRILAAVGTGELTALPAQTFPIEAVADAFRYMAQARHIGKVVVTQRDGASGTGAGRDLFHGDATYLITGGLKGLGLLTAQWMVSHGARNLMLLGRRAASDEATASIHEMAGAGAQVRTARADVSRREDVERVLNEIAASMPPLRGIVHSAGVLDDGILPRQDWGRFSAVLAPKVVGTAHLHDLTLDRPLDFFVLYSSVASLLGSRGQGNHSAANAYLDALAHHRRALGLPGLSINWSGWADVGSVVGHDVGERIVARGLELIVPEQGLETLGDLMRRSLGQAAVMPVNWPAFKSQFVAGAMPAWLAEVADSEAATHVEVRGPDVVSDLKREMEAAQPAQRRKLLVGYVAGQVGLVLRRDPTQPINHRRPLNEMGLDSLMAVELRNLLGTGLGLAHTLPATLVFDRPTVEALTDYLASEVLQWDGAVAVDQGAGDGERPAAVLDAIEDLSTEEVDRLFAERLKGTR